MPKTNIYKEAESLHSYGMMIISNNWAKLEKFKSLTEEEQKLAKLMMEKKKTKKSPAGTPKYQTKEKDAALEENMGDPNKEEGSKIHKKALRKHRAINYNEEGSINQSDTIQDVEEVPNAGPVAPPVKKLGKRKIVPVVKKVETKKQPTQPQAKPEIQPPIQTEKKNPVIENIGKDDTLLGYFELLAQREEEASKCLYSNPIIAQFTDPALCFVEMCALCGAFGNPVNKKQFFNILG